LIGIERKIELNHYFMHISIRKQGSAKEIQN